MKYKLVEIRPGKDAWEYLISDIHGDRVSKDSKPSAIGYYYYPETMEDEQAFEKLKDCMVQEHMDRIERLHRSLEALKLCTLQKQH